MSFVRLRSEAGDDPSKRSGSVTSQGTSVVAGAALGSSGATGIASVGGGRQDAFLGTGSKLVGNATFSGAVEIDCYFEGEINAQGHLTIGKNATIKGTVRGMEITVFGCVQGDIIATQRLSLRKPAKIKGNIMAPNLSIEEGVMFEGSCAMMAPEESSGQTAGENQRATLHAVP